MLGSPRWMVYVNIHPMKRTQIYLDERHTRRLDQRARAGGRTRSELIREAVGRYLGDDEPVDRELESFRMAAEAAFGVAAYLPPGDEYVDAVRAADSARARSLDRLNGD